MSKHIRVLLLNERDPLHPRAGGAEVHVAEVASRLSERGFGLTQYAASFPGASPSERVSGIEVVRLGGLASYYSRLPGRIYRATRSGEFDVVVEHLNKVPFQAPLLSRVPVIAVNHHLFGTSAFAQVAFPIALGVVMLERTLPYTYRKARFLAVSPSSKQDLVERGLPEQGIGLVYNGIRFPTLERQRFADRPLRLAYVGRLEAYKRVEIFLEAVAHLVPRFPDLEAVVIGRGDERERLAGVAEELGIGARTRFTGFVPDEERDRLLSGSRVCVCPSMKEGWGITVVEASAHGVPVVATDAPGLRDAVRPGRTGLLVSDRPEAGFSTRVAEAVASILQDEELGERLGTGGREWARRFTWDEAANVMEREIRSVLGETDTSASSQNAASVE